MPDPSQILCSVCVCLHFAKFACVLLRGSASPVESATQVADLVGVGWSQTSLLQADVHTQMRAVRSKTFEGGQLVAFFLSHWLIHIELLITLPEVLNVVTYFERERPRF